MMNEQDKQRDYWFKQLMRLPLSEHGYYQALADPTGPVNRLAQDIVRAIAQAKRSEECQPITWPSNHEWRCQHGHLHSDGRTALGGDFPL